MSNKFQLTFDAVNGAHECHVFNQRKKPMFSKTLSCLTLIAAAATLTACGSDDASPKLQLQLTSLEDLGSSSVYEGWLIVDGAPVSTGRFTVNSNGQLSQTDFALTSAQAERASTFVLTIEPAVGDVPEPSNQHLMAGDFNSLRTSAPLSISHSAAFGSDFSSAAGKFFLATPTTLATDDNDLGIWFIDPSSGTAQAGLTLPTLPAGWAYEGWVVVNGVPKSTGRFTSPTGADSDGAGSFAGPLAGPAFPGQDFITPPSHLPGGMAVISIEPQPDNSTAPFALKPLINTNISNLVGGSNLQNLTNQALMNAPSGTANISR